jgi:Zn-dependent protease
MGRLMRIILITISLLLFFQFYYIIPVDAVNISTAQTTVQASHPLIFTIRDLQDGSLLRIQVEGNMTVPQGERFSVDIVNLTLPFSLESATFIGTLEGSTDNTLTVQKGEYQIVRTGRGHVSSKISFPVNGSFDHILLQGTSTTGQIYMAPQVSGIKQGPEDSQISFAVEGIESGTLKVKIFVNEELAFDEDIVITPEPPETVDTAGLVSSIALGTAVGLAGAAASAAASSAGTSTVGMLSKGFFGFLKDFGSEHIEERFSEFQSKHPFLSGLQKNVSFEFVGFELFIAILGALLFGLANIVSFKAAFTLDNIFIFITAAGIAIMGHEMAHWYVGRLKKTDTDIHFWGLGTILMFITAYLFGNVFGQPCRTMIDDIDTLKISESAEIMLAGPLVSVGIAVVSAPLLFAGGELMQLGRLSILMNLALATYHMMPFNPMDGQIIYKWNKPMWAIVFIPLIIGYILAFFI